MQKYTRLDPENYTADELTISNMIKFLENPNLLALCDENEMKIIANVVKNHVVERAIHISKIHDEYLENHPNKLGL